MIVKKWYVYNLDKQKYLDDIIEDMEYINS